MGKSLVIAVLLSSILLGCSTPTSTEIASLINGAWTLRFDPPESFFGFSLTSSGADVSGSGDFQGEAGPGGSLTVTGSVAGDQVDLDFVLVTEFTGGSTTSTAHFTGRLLFGSLTGEMQYGSAAPDNPPVPTVFLRNH